MNRDISLKKKQNSPKEKLLKSFYSKQKSKSKYSPNANRSISKEQIKHQIKKVVYNVNHSQDRTNLYKNYEQQELTLAPR